MFVCRLTLVKFCHIKSAKLFEGIKTVPEELSKATIKNEGN